MPRLVGRKAPTAESVAPLRETVFYDDNFENLKPGNRAPFCNSEMSGGVIIEEATSGESIPVGDRSAPYPTPAVLKALGFSSAQKYRDAHLTREYPQQQQVTAPSDDEFEDTPYQVELANRIRKLVNERTPGWN